MNAHEAIPDLDRLIDQLSPADAAFLRHRAEWLATARPEQIPPEGGWNEFGAQAGRGFGKTRLGSEWMAEAAWRDPQRLPRGVVAATQADVRLTCFEGQSGLLNILPPECVADYNRTDVIIRLTGGGLIRGYSAEKASRLRGPEHADVWCFVAGTMVSTPDGEVPIEQLTPGDLVLTRNGPRSVLANACRKAMVGRVSFSHGRSLAGTADHPVYLASGWTRLDQLQLGDRVCATFAASPSARVPALSAASVVSTWQPKGQQSVYCLKVAGEPEYFANGVLVHNCDEIGAAWGPQAEDVLDMIEFGLRLGENPRLVWTSTPKPVPIVRKLVAPRPGRIIVRGSTYDNRDNLAASFIEKIAVYEGTKLGRQELYGELIDPEEAGIVRRTDINLWPHDKPLPVFSSIILSLDTAFTEKTLDKKGDPDPSACGCWGVFAYKGMNHIMLLDAWQDHLGIMDLMRRVKKEMAKRYGGDEDTPLVRPLVGATRLGTSGHGIDMLLIEDKGSGISLRQMLTEQGIHAMAYNPGRADKLTRLHIVSPLFNAKRVWMVESSVNPGHPVTWAEPVIEQLCTFAGEGSIKHDDHVDQTTQALRVAMDMRMLPLVKAKPRLPEDVERERAGIKPRSNPYAQ